jgi:hypothetical protein
MVPPRAIGVAENTVLVIPSSTTTYTTDLPETTSISFLGPTTVDFVADVPTALTVTFGPFLVPSD